MEEPEQLVFEKILEQSPPKETEKEPLVLRKKASVPRKARKGKRKAPTKPLFYVSLVHEDGVDWKLECHQVEPDEMDSAYYDHLAREALRMELLRLLKQDKPVVQQVHIITLVLRNLGGDVPEYLMIDANKNLFEGDFWCDYEQSSKKAFDGVAHSFLWAFYFKEFANGERVAERSFTEYPAEETDLSFLLDHEFIVGKYPGVTAFS